MIKPSTLLLSCFLTAPHLYAHEGGHNPAVTDGGRYGGLLTTMTQEHEHHEHHEHHINHEHHDHDLESTFKAELVRASDLNVYLYIYKNGVNPADSKTLSNEIKGWIVSGGEKKQKREEFSLKLSGKSYSGKSPKITRRPYTMEFQVTIEGKKLLATFANLD